MTYMSSFYVDTCIYLNLWKKERGVVFGKPVWSIARDFFAYVSNIDGTIYYSGFLLKELYYKLGEDEFTRKKKAIESSSNFIRANLNEKEYELAGQIMKRAEPEISFFDIVHLVLARKVGAIFITRDKQLLSLAKRFKVVAKKPEEIIN